MTDDLRLRCYKPDDIDRVWELHERVLHEVDAYAEDAAEFGTDLDSIPETYLNGGEFLVGLLNGTIVAMGGIRPVDETTAELK
jgi:hypothetical protein